ncbi:c57f4609-6e75-457c-9977-1ae3357e2075 [Thermothielavioides terrestris]|uniref:C57f4609-6e75-457c-9977-1ae3357e2075 n=1 Tax=Thermothielavioides terrestris TaxID=2587410 RepID=A0A3S4EU85_9PEZI|nr:c57f4609-6e75-457c-9977-1ae3357e2075 [Thermothielavioides terrestris]
MGSPYNNLEDLVSDGRNSFFPFQHDHKHKTPTTPDPAASSGPRPFSFRPFGRRSASDTPSLDLEQGAVAAETAEERVEGREETVRLPEEPDGAAGWIGGPWWALVTGRGLVVRLEVGWGSLVLAVEFCVGCGALVFSVGLGFLVAGRGLVIRLEVGWGVLVVAMAAAVE